MQISARPNNVKNPRRELRDRLIGAASRTPTPVTTTPKSIWAEALSLHTGTFVNAQRSAAADGAGGRRSRWPRCSLKSRNDS